MTPVPSTQHAIQFVGRDQAIHNSDKAVGEAGPTQMLIQVEACGICFSDVKLLRAFEDHPRKAGVVAGMTPDVLAGIPSYTPGTEATVPGHEVVGRIVEAGDQVMRYKVGDRVCVQANWKHLPTPGSSSAMGYNFEGALQEYVVVDEACVVSADGEDLLLPVTDAPTSAAIALIEPWATVEASYRWPERNHTLPGGRLLVVADAETSRVEALIANHEPAEVVTCASDDLGTATGLFDDIIYYGADAGQIEALSSLLDTAGTLCVVLDGKSIPRKVRLDIGRIHYDFVRFIGTPGNDPADAYAWVPENGELREGDTVAILGASGPMGQIHALRTVASEIRVASIHATGRDDGRLEHLASLVQPAATQKGIDTRFINVKTTKPGGNYSYISCMVPDPALIAQSIDLAGEGAIINAYAGIPVGSPEGLDLQAIIDRRIFMLGTSGSDVSDMRTVLHNIETQAIDIHVLLDAVTGMAGFHDALEAIGNRTAGGKIVVYPNLHDLPLIRLADMPDQLPQVAAKLRDGVWTKEAEAALLDGASPVSP